MRLLSDKHEAKRGPNGEIYCIGCAEDIMTAFKCAPVVLGAAIIITVLYFLMWPRT